MGPYSHLIIADRLVPDLQPDDLPSYYWGAVAPDTRYLVPGMHRSQTHINTDRLFAYTHEYPQFHDFILGYRVHLCTDWLDLSGLLRRKFPFMFLRRKLPTHTASSLVEFYNLNHPFQQPPPVSGTHNPLLAELGISAQVARIFADNLRAYLANPSYQAVLEIFMVPGIETNPRVAQYQAAAGKFDRSGLLKQMVFWGLQAGHINTEITKGVRKILAEQPYGRRQAPDL